MPVHTVTTSVLNQDPVSLKTLVFGNNALFSIVFGNNTLFSIVHGRRKNRFNRC
jgi:hypothetical protein